MADQDRVGAVAKDLSPDRAEGHGVKIGIDEPDVMARVDQRAADAEQAEGRQIFPWNAAADGGMGRVEKDDTHGLPLCHFALRNRRDVQDPRRKGAARVQEDRPVIFTVAIDGPAAAGKGTISRAVAAHFGFAHLDTGLLYRAVGARGGDPVAAAEGLSEADLARDDLRTLAAGQAASKVAVIPEVRAALVAFQRQFARRAGGAVLDGRDIGTVICPEAEVKLFVTASAEVRAHRRWLEVGGDEGQVLAEVIDRDRRDAERATAPLRPAEDAVLLDTTELSIDAAVHKAIEAIEKRIEQGRA